MSYDISIHTLVQHETTKNSELHGPTCLALEGRLTFW